MRDRPREEASWTRCKPRSSKPRGRLWRLGLSVWALALLHCGRDTHTLQSVDAQRAVGLLRRAGFQATQVGDALQLPARQARDAQALLDRVALPEAPEACQGGWLKAVSQAGARCQQLAHTRAVEDAVASLQGIRHARVVEGDTGRATVIVYRRPDTDTTTPKAALALVRDGLQLAPDATVTLIEEPLPGVRNDGFAYVGAFRVPAEQAVALRIALWSGHVLSALALLALLWLTWRYRRDLRLSAGAALSSEAQARPAKADASK